jgi:hypothetical protein
MAVAILGAGCVDLTPPWKASPGRDAPSVVPNPGGGGTGFEDGPGSGAGPGLDASQSEPGPDISDAGYSTSDSSPDARERGSDSAVSEVFEVDLSMDSAAGDADVPVALPDAPASGLDDGPVDKDAKATSRYDLRMDAETGARADGSDGAIDASRSDGTTDLGGAGGVDTGALGSGGTGGTTSGSGGTSTGTGGSGSGGSGGSTSGDASVGCIGTLSPDAGARLGEELVAYYRCEEAAGTTLADSSGHSADGTLVAGVGGNPGFAYGPGQSGQAVYFSSAHQGYATLPSTLLTDAQEATVATWVYLNNAVNWQRIFDFGRPESDGTSKVYMYLAAEEDVHGYLHFAISNTGPGSSEQTMDGPVLSTKTWHHVAVVLGPSGGRLYVDGCRVDSNSRVSLRPADLPSPLSYYIGLSQWTRYPVYLDANIDEFRVYARALSSEEIQALAAGL